MAGLRFLTAGESHGPGLTVIVDGIPHGLRLTREQIDRDLRRRQGGYGRGGRMKIERDRIELKGGVRHGRTLGGPVALWLENRDFGNWQEAMSPDPLPSEAGVDRRALTRPRPGHADLAGTLKLGIDDARDVLERASARETAARVAAGAVAKALLGELGITIAGHTVRLGEVALGDDKPIVVPWRDVVAAAADADFRVSDGALREAMRHAVDAARAAGDTLGGELEVVAHTPPPGLGHYTHWDRRLDGRIAQAMLSVPSAKAVSIGLGAWAAARRGSEVHDPIQHDQGGFRRPSNRAGGIEGGMTNGEEVRIRVAVKPISTLRRPLRSADLRTGEAAEAGFERSDVTVVPAASVVAEAMLALVLADAALDKFGGDSMAELRRNYDGYVAGIDWRPPV